MNKVNGNYSRLRLEGLNPAYCYQNIENGSVHYGNELMYAALIITDDTAGQVPTETPSTDFESRIYVLKAAEE